MSKQTIEISAVALRTIGNQLILEVEHAGSWVRIGWWMMPRVPADERLVISEIIEVGGIMARIDAAAKGEDG
jgi:hypothetical protein